MNYAQEQYGEYLTVENSIVPDLRKEIVAIKVVGNSMTDAGLNNGDYVMVEVGEHPQNDDLVVAIIGDMAVVKRIQFTKNAVILMPESKNKMYQLIILSDTSKIFGKALRTIKIRPGTEDYTYEAIKDSL